MVGVRCLELQELEPGGAPLSRIFCPQDPPHVSFSKDSTILPYLTMATLKSQVLYGGAIKAIIPEGWLDASDLRQIPDHQELFLSPSTLSNFIFEINERVSEETALSALQSAPNKEVLETLGPNPGATPESVNKAAALYHLNDIRDEDGDALQIVAPPQQVSVQKIPAARAYKGVAHMTSSTVRASVAPSTGGAPAGSSADTGLVTTVSVHYLLVRLEEQETDILVFLNVPHKEFDERGDPRGLSGEKELANSVIDGLVEKLEIVDWGLFGG
ncbi:Ran GTPase-binding protein MOG1 [Aspergillus undulatus]|uniref:Ran GTPase-binding protein MOG1 n=1 Tax=Aspergillus undulatus TaxID=1810928 RepID=UPI003CCD5E40